MSAVSLSSLVVWPSVADALGAIEVLAVIGVVVWASGLAWLVLTDVMHAISHSKHRRHHDTSQGPEIRRSA